MSDSNDAPRSLQSEASRLADAARDRAGDAIEEIKMASNQVVDKVRELIEEGNVRRISLRKGERTLFEIPLTVGVGAGAAALLYSPAIAAVGALAALVTDVTLVIERDASEATSADVAALEEHVENVNEPAPSDDATDKTMGKGDA
ncbi:MAG: hypothetical protein Rubg2KO_09730 [Rubricoccaceae bacterium]